MKKLVLLFLFYFSLVISWGQTCPCQDYVYVNPTNKSASCPTTPQSITRSCDLTRWYKAEYGKLRIPLFFHIGQNIVVSNTEIDNILLTVNSWYQSSNVRVEFFSGGKINETWLYDICLDNCCSNSQATVDKINSISSNTVYKNYINIFFTNQITTKDKSGQCVSNKTVGIGDFPKEGNAVLIDRSIDKLKNEAEIRFTLAHELGHSLGLYHTFTNDKFSGDICRSQDGIWDTPYDNGDGSVQSNINNLMNYNDYFLVNNNFISVNKPKISPCQNAKILDVLFECRKNLGVNPSTIAEKPTVKMNNAAIPATINVMLNTANPYQLQATLNGTNKTNTGDYATWEVYLSASDAKPIKTYKGKQLDLRAVALYVYGIPTIAITPLTSFTLKVLDQSIYNPTIKSTAAATQQYTVKINASCGAPTGLVATNPTVSGAKLGWTAAANAKSYEIQYKKSTDTNWPSIPQVSNLTNNSYDLKNLLPSSTPTIYQFRIRSYCNYGVSAWSAVGTFTTLPKPTGDLRIFTNGITTTTTSGTIQQGKALNVYVPLKNYGTTNYNYDIQCSIHAPNNPTPIQMLTTGTVQNYNMSAGTHFTLIFSTNNVLVSGNYQIWVEHRPVGQSNFALVSQDIYKNPLNITIAPQAVSQNTLLAFGRNSDGQLGDGSTRYKNIPTKISSEFIQIESGKYHTLGIKADGTLWAWGDNDYGQLGDGTNVDKSTPIPVQVGSKFSKISAGGYHSLAIKTDGTLWAWGGNWNGQLGDGSELNKLSPLKIGSGYSEISAGGLHSLAIKIDGTIWAWGKNNYGELGDGTYIDKYIPVSIQIGSKFSKIAAGGHHSLAIKTDGTLWAWGGNFDGQLGDGTFIRKSTPIKIGIKNTYTQVATGNSHTLALENNGTLWAWGFNYDGQVGDGTSYTVRNTPINIGNEYKRIAAGEDHSIASKIDGSLLAWGDSSLGQLGLGDNATSSDKLIPTLIPICGTNTNISAGGYHTVCLQEKCTVSLNTNNENLVSQMLINENRSINKDIVISIIPNPATNDITLTYISNTENGETINFDLYDTVGKRILSQKQSAVNGKNSYQIDVSHLPKGMYIIRVQGKEGFLTEKVIIQR